MRIVTGPPILEKLPPRFRDEGTQCVIASEGQSAVLSAELFELTPDTELFWSKDGDRFVPEPRHRQQIDKNTVQLVLDSINKEDSGIYSLSAKTSAGTTTRDLELRVTSPDGGEEDQPPAFLRRLNDLSVKVGTRTRFLVEIKTASEVTIEWFHNDTPVKEGERYRFINEGGFHCVDVAPVVAKDAGKWTCTAQNLTGHTSSTCNLNVLVPKTYKAPEFLEELQAILTDQGTVSLECKVVGVPTPLLHWFKDGNEIKAGDAFALTANPDDPTTLGTYTCEAVNCMGKVYSSSRVHVVGRGSREGSLKPADSGISTGPPPSYARDLNDETIKIGDPLFLSCQVSVPPWPKSIIWFNSEGRINDETPEGRYKSMADGLGGYMLEVRPTEAADQGQWKCVATSDSGAKSVSTCEVHMIIPKHFRKPRFMESLKAVLTEEGLVSFECKVVGSPTPLLRWFKDGQELKPGDVYQLTGSNSLGSYCCIARNCMGEAVSSAELTVEDIQNQLNDEERQQLLSKSQAPKFIHGLKSCEARINENFKFTVQVSIAPLPNLSWYRDDQPIEMELQKYNAKQESNGFGTLDILPLEFMDQAEWKCVARNDFGHSITSCFLKLVIPKHFRKPRFLECLRAVLSEEGAVNLECKVIGVPQPILTWYKDGMELKPGDIHRITSGEDGTCCLGTYTCEAKNCMGIVASSASLLGFEDQSKTRAEQQRIELAKVPSLSTIHEERTSQLYDTPQADLSLTINDHGELSFSFDGKEVSLSLYETPDITEDEAIQIVEMYADQLSEHVSEHNVVELPPLRFTKETSTSGNFVMEAVVVDVSDDYFTSAEEDLRTEADVTEIYSITEEGARALSPSGTSNGDVPKRPPRKKNDSQKSSNSYYSLSKNASIDTDVADESLAMDTESYGDFESAISSDRIRGEEDMAFQVAAITETTSLPGDRLLESPVSPQNTHEIGSDLRVDRDEGVKKKRRRRKQSRQSSQSSDESSKEGLVKNGVKKKAQSLELGGDIFYRDVQGEEGDGLVIDPEVNAMKMKELSEKEKEVAEKLQKTLQSIQENLNKVEQELVIQTSLKTTAAAANKSIEVLHSLMQPIQDMQMFLLTLEQQEEQREGVSIAEMIAPPIFDLQKGLSIVEKCVEMQGKEHTLIQKTCFNILEKGGKQIQRGLKLIENMSLLEKEMIPTNAAGRITPSKIIQEVLITLQEMQNGLDKSVFIMNSKAALQQAKRKSPAKETATVKETDILETESDIDILLRFAQPAFELQETLTNIKEEILESEISKSNIYQKIKVHVAELVDEISSAERHVHKLKESNVEQPLYSALIEQLTNPIKEISNNLDILPTLETADKYDEAAKLDMFEEPIEEIINSLSKMGKDVTSLELSQAESSTADVVKEVFDQVSQLIFQNVLQTVQDFLYNLENAQKSTTDTVVLEALRQMSSLQKDLATTVKKSAEVNTEGAVMALERLAQPLDMINNQLLDIPTAQPSDILDDMVACLSILEDCIVLNESIEENENLLVSFSILKARAGEVKENVCMLIEPPSVSEYQRPPLLQHLSEEKVTDEVVEESAATLPVPPIVEEDSAVSKYEDLKKCIATIQDLSIMSEETEIEIDSETSTEKAKAFVETVQDLEKFLVTLQEDSTVETAQKIPTEIFQEASEVIECVEKLKNSAIFEKTTEEPVITVEDIVEIKTLSGPLRRLSKTIDIIEGQKDERLKVFKNLEEPLKAIENCVITLGEHNVSIGNIDEHLANAIEIISLEKNNFDISLEDARPLIGISDHLNSIKNLLWELHETNLLDVGKLKATIELLQLELKDIESKDNVKFIIKAVEEFTNHLQETVCPTKIECKAIKDVCILSNQLEQQLAVLTEKESLNPKQGEIKDLQKSLRAMNESISNIEAIEMPLETIAFFEHLQQCLQSAQESFEEMQSVEVESISDLMKEKPSVIADLNNLLELSVVLSEPIQDQLKEVAKCANKVFELSEADVVLSTTEEYVIYPQETESSQTKIAIETLSKYLTTIVTTPLDINNPKHGLISTITDKLFKPFELNIKTATEIELKDDDSEAIKQLTGLVVNIESATFEDKPKITASKKIINDLKEIETIQVVNPALIPLITIMKEAAKSCLDDINVIVDEDAQNRLVKMKAISQVTDAAQELVKNIASIKYAEVEKALVIKLQRTLYGLQMSINDLIDSELNDEDQKIIQQLEKSLQIIDEFILLKTARSSKLIEKDQVLENLDVLENLLNKNISETSHIKSMLPELNNLVANSKIVITQIHDAHQINSKSELIKSKFTNVAQIIKEKVEQSNQESKMIISDIEAHLRELKQNASMVLQQPQENQLSDQETNYIQVLENTVTNLEEALSKKVEKQTAIAKIKEISQNIEFVDVGESPLNIVTPQIKEICKIVITMLEIVEKDEIKPKEEIETQEIKETANDEHDLLSVEVKDEKQVVVAQEQVHIESKEKELQLVEEVGKQEIEQKLVEVESDKVEVNVSKEKVAEIKIEETKGIEVPRLLEDVNIEEEQLKVGEIAKIDEVKVEIKESIVEVEEKKLQPEEVEKEKPMENEDEAMKVEEQQQIIEQPVQIEEPKPSTSKDQKTTSEENIPHQEEKAQLLMEVDKESLLKEEEIKVSQEVKEEKQMVEMQKDEITSVQTEEPKPSVPSKTEEISKQEEITPPEVEKKENLLEVKNEQQILEAPKEEPKPSTSKDVNLENKSDEEKLIITELEKKPTEVKQPIINQLESINTFCVSNVTRELPQKEKLERIVNIISVIAKSMTTSEINVIEDLGKISIIENLLEKCLESIQSEIVTNKISQEIVVNIKKDLVDLPTESQSAQIISILQQLIRVILNEEVQIPVVKSLKTLKDSVGLIEKEKFSESKQAAINELEKSIIALETTLQNKLSTTANLDKDEVNAIEKAEKTLSEINSFLVTAQNISLEESSALPDVTVNVVKTSIEELRLAVVAIKQDSQVKEIMEPLEETAKNVINLFEGIPEEEALASKYSESMANALQNTIRTIVMMDKTKLEDLKRDIFNHIGKQLVKLEEKILKVRNVGLRHDMAAVLEAGEKCINHFNEYLANTQNVNYENVDEEKSKALIATLKEFQGLEENIGKHLTYTPIVEQLKNVNVNIFKLLEKTEPVTPKEIPESLKKLQNILQDLQENVSSLNPASDVKAQKVAVHEMPRPLTALQFIAENILVGKSEKLSQDELHVLEITAACMEDINTIIEESDSKGEIEKIEESLSKLQIAVASVNQESQIKDILEPLQDISNTVEKILEKEKVAQSELKEQKSLAIKRFSSSVTNLSKVILKYVEQKLPEPKMIVLTELQKPLRAIIESMGEITDENVTKKDMKELNNLTDSVDNIAKCLEENQSVENIDKSLQELNESLGKIIVIKDEQIEEIPKAPTPSTINVISENLSDLQEAIHFTHLVLEKPKTIEDVSQLRNINTPLNEFLKLILVIKHEKGDLNLLSELQTPLHQLELKLHQSVNAKIVEEEIPILERIGNEFTKIIDISKSKEFKDLNLNDFSNPLDALQNVIISVCSRAVLTNIPEDQESIIQKISEPLDKIIKGIIKIKTKVGEI
nr:titin-like [Onthophagus taurus]